MKHFCIYFCFILLIGCSTVPRPDLPTKKENGKRYEQYQSTCLGKPLGKPKWREVPSAMASTQATLKLPAKWTLYMALPAAFALGALCLVAAVYLQNEKLSKLAAVLSGASFLAALGATAWLIATTWMWVTALLLGLTLGTIILIVYK